MKSYWGKLLEIDLTLKEAKAIPLEEAIFRQYLGGVGLAVWLLFRYAPAGVKPLSPDNPLIFATSPLLGTMTPASGKYAVAAKSPLTGFIGDSLSSGSWALELKQAGFDALVLRGACEEWSYIFIQDGQVHFRDSAALRGLSSPQVDAAIREELGDEAIRVSSIGLAGENLVSYACISNDEGRQAGRTGNGAVMGAKRLKAIAVRGSQRVEVAAPERFGALCERMFIRAQGPLTEKYSVLGTTSNLLVLNRLGALPTRNFQQGTFEGAEAISGEELGRRFLSQVSACLACPVGCDHRYRVPEGEYEGAQIGLDYQTLYALGPACGIDHPSAIIRAAQACDDYGLDTISTGLTVAWAMECYERGIFGRRDAGGLELRFGNHAALVATIERIARRQGLGALLAEGTKRASERIGQGSERWAMQVKGLEMPGYDPRAMKTLALGYAVGTRGACHNRSAGYEVDMSGRVDRFRGGTGRGALAMEQEDFATVLDSVTICKFLRRCFEDFYGELSQLYELGAGIDITPQEIERAGERINNLKKLFNIRQGWQRSDDWLPSRVMEEPLPDGVGRGEVVTAEELAVMIDDYYRARGWTDEGLISEEKLRELGLEWTGEMD